MEKLGKKLGEAVANKKKIYAEAVIRLVVSGVFCFLVSGGGTDMENTTMQVLCIAVVLIIGLYPLIHLPEKLEFYEEGIVHNGIVYLWSDMGSVEWQDYTMGSFLYRMSMATECKDFDITYLDCAKKQYNKAYLND